MPTAYWCILAAVFLPIILAGYAKSGSRDNNTPRDSADTFEGPKRRAYAAHQNALENFAFFAIAVIAAIAFGAATPTLNALAVLYIGFRILHGLFYIADKASLRSLAYAGGLFTNIAIFVLPALK